MPTSDPTGGITPDDLNTTDTTDDSSTPDPFNILAGGVVTLAGAALHLPIAQNSPTPNNAPSNVPSTVPTSGPSKTSSFAGWSTAKKIWVGVGAGILVILAFFGIKKLFSD